MAVTEIDARSGPNPIALATIALGAAAAAILLATRTMRLWHEGAGTVDRVVELSIEAGATVCAAWIALGAVVGLLYAVIRCAGRDWHAGRAFLARCAPRIVRRMAGVVVTAGVGVAIAAPSAFASPAAGTERDGDAPSGVVLDLGWQPTPDASAGGVIGSDSGADAADLAGPSALASGTGGESAGGPTTSRRGDDGSATHGSATHGSDRSRDPERTRQVDRKARAGAPRDTDVPVVVERGDTLWSIAAEHLRPGGASPGAGALPAARVAREVAAWHAANREAIGPDPDLIRPGTVLHAPDARPVGARR
ncbi:LysM peptidoglycan-binding domain-containing protein [Myceligenerans pegani]|nr:LysM peptidoglycan-binding domain-containing protein [Myceligenerans sp. TRM 65318]